MLSQSEVGIRWSSAANASNSLHATDVNTLLFQDLFLPHLTRGTGGPTVPAISDIVFDAGFSSKAEAESYGVRPGDTLVPDSSAILTANGKTSSPKHGITATAS